LKHGQSSGGCRWYEKGLFVLEGSTSAKRLELRGPSFPGMPLNTVLIDRRSKTPKVIAVPSSPWFGTTIQVSKDLGKKFKPTKSAPRSPPTTGAR